MKRAFISLCLLLILAVLTQKANSACDPITVVNNLPDTVKVGFGGKLTLSSEFTCPDIPVDSCTIVSMSWADLTNSASIVAGTFDHPDTGTTYTGDWRPANAETVRIVPYAVDSLANAHYSSDTTVVIVKDGLWYPEAFHYRGAFKVPTSDGTGGNSYSSYGAGSMMAYCPNGEDGDSDGYTGSIYINGFMIECSGCSPLGGEICQITIPTPVISPSRNTNDLNRASFIQNFHDAFQGQFTSWSRFPGSEPKPGDMVYVPAGGGLTYDALYFTFRDTYVGGGTGNDFYSLGRVPADLNDFRPMGMWHLGPLDPSPSIHTEPGTNERSWADYMFPAPLNWSALHTGAKWMISGMGDREAATDGASRGATMYAWNPLFPDRLGSCPTGVNCVGPVDTTKIPVKRLLQYPPNLLSGGAGSCDSSTGTRHINASPLVASADGAISSTNMTQYTLVDSWQGGAWITNNNKQAIAFCGTKCKYGGHYSQHEGGTYCDGNACPENTGWVCGHDGDATPAYWAGLWFYDPDDIAQVADSGAVAWDPQPYAVLPLTEFQWDPAECQPGFADITYDPDAGRLYISEKEVEGNPNGDLRPLIHVFDITPWESYLVTFDLESESYVHRGDSVHVALTWDLQTTADCTFGTDSTSVASIEVVVADSTFSIDTAPLANGGTALYETTIPCPTWGIMSVRGRMTIDASGTDCDGSFDTQIKTVWVANY